MAGLVSLIGQEPRFEVRAGQQADEGVVDVIVADYECGLSLLASTLELHDGGPGLPVPRIIVVTHRDKEVELARAIDSGAHGFLRQETNPAELMDAIRHVAGGGSVYLCGRTRTLFNRGTPRTDLTAREEDVLRFLVKGDGNKGIARKLDISTHTVKTHVSKICEKLQVSSRVQVAVKATQRGLVRV
ncbi:response regulator transcription factor [Variovorax sp. J22P271]|uniref:LuxR C-terminal-related transcriptional regulator n=1 Tax=Variovorax davisae TaxID=3053515 RepID=UPI002577C909|nr:response regulator transcription factor [Variovorax sp. J22P271]MDM0033460.1 response regulator transcription factor [Variovorax sp. J22P271]